MIIMTTPDFGKSTFEGKEYILTSQVDFTNRVLHNLKNFHEVSEGEEYSFQLSCQAIDSNWDEYTLYWVFTATKGEEVELDSYNYDNVSEARLN